MIVSNIGATPDFSAIYTTNSAQHTAFVQVSLDGRPQDRQLRIHGAREARMRRARCPNSAPTFSPAGLVDAVLNLGLPAPIDVQVAGSDMEKATTRRSALAAQIRKLRGVADVFIPQDIDYPALQLDVDRTRASELGLDQEEVVDNVITALTSNHDDRAQLLDRSQNGQRLHADRAISRRSGKEPRPT